MALFVWLMPIITTTNTPTPTLYSRIQASAMLGLPMSKFASLARLGVLRSAFPVVDWNASAPIWDVVGTLKPALELYTAALKTSTAVELLSRGIRLPSFIASWGYSKFPYSHQYHEATMQMAACTNPDTKEAMRVELISSDRYLSGIFIKLIRPEFGQLFRNTMEFRCFCAVSPDFGRCVYANNTDADAKPVLLGCLVYPAKKDPAEPFGPTNIEWLIAKPNQLPRGRKKGAKLSETTKMIFRERIQATRARRLAAFRKAYSESHEMQAAIPPSKVPKSLQVILDATPTRGKSPEPRPAPVLSEWTAQFLQDYAPAKPIDPTKA